MRAVYEKTFVEKSDARCRDPRRMGRSRRVCRAEQVGIVLDMVAGHYPCVPTNAAGYPALAGSPTRTTFARSPERTDYGSSGPSCDSPGIRKCLLLALNSLPELPLVGLISGANQTPFWQPPETGLTPKRA